jgi:hypothetical protein
MAYTTAMPYLRLANGEWVFAGTIEKKRNSADDFRLLGQLDFIILGSKCSKCSPMEKKNPFFEASLKNKMTETFKDMVLRLIWQQK